MTETKAPWLAEQGGGARGIDRAGYDLRAFAEAWPDSEFVQQVAAQLPWGHNLLLLTKLKEPAQRTDFLIGF